MRRSDCWQNGLLAFGAIIVAGCGPGAGSQDSLGSDIAISHAAGPQAVARRLDVHGPRVTDDGLMELAGRPEIERIWIRGTPNVTGAGFKACETWPNLRSVALLNVPISDARAFEFVSRSETLEELNVCVLQLSQEHVAQIAESDSLLELWFQEVEGLDAENLLRLGTLSTLRSLSIVDCPGVEPEDIEALQALLPACPIHYKAPE